MSGIQPVAVYAMRVPPGDIMVPAVPEFAAMVRLRRDALISLARLTVVLLVPLDHGRH